MRSGADGVQKVGRRYGLGLEKTVRGGGEQVRRPIAGSVGDKCRPCELQNDTDTPVGAAGYRTRHVPDAGIRRNFPAANAPAPR